MELFAADGHDASGCERVTGKSGMRPKRRERVMPRGFERIQLLLSRLNVHMGGLYEAIEEVKSDEDPAETRAAIRLLESDPRTRGWADSLGLVQLQQRREARLGHDRKRDRRSVVRLKGNVGRPGLVEGPLHWLKDSGIDNTSDIKLASVVVTSGRMTVSELSKVPWGCAVLTGRGGRTSEDHNYVTSGGGEGIVAFANGVRRRQ